MNNYNYKNLTPFKWFILENFPFIEADFDALTEWQLFCKLGKEINKQIDKINELGLQVENVTNAFIQLQNYVTNYFDNLDIQEEINNKLNEMAESGELAEIIAQYIQLQGILAYNNIEDLKNAENLENGSFAKTYGKITYNDGMGAFYKIRSIVNTDIIDNDNLVALTNYPNLVAEKIQEIKDKINVKLFGINGNNTDVTQNLQDLINKLGSNTYYFPAGIYHIENIELPSNTIIEGEEGTKFIIDTNDIISQFKIINKENITIKNCDFRNGDITGDGVVYGSIDENIKACIYGYNSQNINVENCKFDTIYWGILLHLCNNNYINNCKFTNTGYNAIFVVGNSDNTNITNCLFDTAHETNVENTYFIAFTETNYETGTGYPTNCTVDNCTFKNNIYWEAVDSHGSNGTIITNNKFYNCRYPINLLNDQRFVNRHLHMKDILIDNNYIDMNNIADASAIIVVGSVNGTQLDYFMCKNVIITNNTIVNGAGAEYPYRYLLWLYYMENFIIKNNNIECNRGGVRLHCCIFGEFSNNNINSDPYAFYISNSHVVTMENNKFITKTIANYIGNFEPSNVILRNNLGNYNTYLGGGIGYLRYANYGQHILNINTLAETRDVVTSKYVTHKGNTDEVSTVKAKTTSGSDIVETDTDFLSDLSMWQHIIIAGGGTSGANLDCVIMEYIDNKHFRINAQAGTTLNNFANITKVHYTTTQY